MSHIFTRTGDTTLLFDVELIVKQEWAIPENIHTPPMDDTELVPQNFRIPRRIVAVYAGFQTRLIQNLREFQNFA